MAGADDEREYDIEALRLTQQEARNVLNHQIDIVNDIDDKASYTLRLNILLLGLLLTISSLFVSNQSTPAIDRFGSPAIGLGILFTGSSIVTALWAYTSTQVQVGPDPEDIERLRTNRYTERDWLVLLLRSYTVWMAQNERANRRDGFTLFVSHTLLFIELGYYSFGILWGLFVPNWPLWLHLVILVALFPLLVLVVVFPRLPIADRIIAVLWKRFSTVWKQLFNIT